MKIGEHFLGNLHEADFRITHGRRAVAVDRAEVALTVDERIAHGEILRHADNRLIRRAVAVRVEFTEHFTHHAGGLLRGRIPDIPDFLHRVKHAAVHGLQAVANIRKRAPDDDAHCVVEIRLAHLVLNGYREKLLGNGIARGRGGPFGLTFLFVDRLTLVLLVFVHQLTC